MFNQYVPSHVEIVKQDVIKDDEPKRLIEEWVCLEGEVVFKDKHFFNFDDSNFDNIVVNERKLKVYKNRLKNFEDIKEGDIVYSTWYEGEVVAMKVENIDIDKHTAMGKLSDYCYGYLYFNDDCRECWRCGGYSVINNFALAKLSL